MPNLFPSTVFKPVFHMRVQAITEVTEAKHGNNKGRT